jgi:ribosome biogenesis GTPase / thiamine phosphate phosphatase
MASMNKREFLQTLGWNEDLENAFRQLPADPPLVPGRVVGQEKTFYRVLFSQELVTAATLPGRMWHDPNATAQLPAVGDWVACAGAGSVEEIQILQVLPRKSLLLRKRPGTTLAVQLIAANVDSVMVVSSLNEDFDKKRIERYLKVAWESEAQPVLLLTKSDLSERGQEILAELKEEFKNIQIFLLSKNDPSSYDQLRPYFSVSKTSVLVGSSGVGKSTLVNYLLGRESQKTQDVSNDSKGRHTTTSRDLLGTRWGGWIIDTPGMRDIAWVDDEEDLSKDFSDVEAIILRCKFTNCQHKTEPGCAIHAALKDETLTADRWDRFLQRPVVAERYQKNVSHKTNKFDSKKGRKK